MVIYIFIHVLRMASLITITFLITIMLKSVLFIGPQIRLLIDRPLAISRSSKSQYFFRKAIISVLPDK